MTKELIRTTLPILPPAVGFEGGAEYMKQVAIWKEWIQWEKDDNLVLKEEDLKAYHDRILYVYKQALMALQFWPEIWYDAAVFCFNSGLDKQALEFLNHGIASNPESCLLAFKLADQIELTTVNDESSDSGAKLRTQKVREPYNKVLDALYELVTKAKAREARELKQIEDAQLQGNADSAMSGREDDDDDEESDSAIAEVKRAAVQSSIDAVKTGIDAEVQLLQKTISFAWVALMRAVRRIQGKGMPGEKAGGFRVIFGDARKRGRLTSDFYIACASIEYHCYQDDNARKIYERGLKLYPGDAEFALAYLKHLVATNDVTSTLALRFLVLYFVR